MKNHKIMLVLFTMIAASVAIPASGAATSVPTTHTLDVEMGCQNFGNHVSIGSSRTCSAGTNCTNFGTQIFIGSTYQCTGGECPNHGIRISVASNFCGNSDTHACVGSMCISPSTPISPGPSGLDRTSISTASANYTGRLEFTSPPASQDCLPKLTVWKPTWHITMTCDPSGQPCGIMQQPVCWTFRFSCMQALIIVLRVYDGNSPLSGGEINSTCEGQPGWPPSSPANSGSDHFAEFEVSCFAEFCEATPLQWLAFFDRPARA